MKPAVVIAERTAVGSPREIHLPRLVPEFVPDWEPWMMCRCLTVSDAAMAEIRAIDFAASGFGWDELVSHGNDVY